MNILPTDCCATNHAPALLNKRAPNTYFYQRATLLLGLLLMLFTSSAFAETAINFQQILANGEDDGSGNIIAGLDGASDVTVSADGQHVYAAGSNTSSLAVFERNASNGQLTFLQALINAEDDGSGNTIAGLGSVNDVIVSPDGMHVYAAGLSDNAVAVFARDASTGRLTFVEALVQDQNDSLGNTVDGIDNIRTVIVSPDNSHVYAAGRGDSALAVFSRNAATGILTFTQLLKDRQDDGSGNTIEGLLGVVTVAISPDGANVYAAAQRDDAVVVFDRSSATGRLTFREFLEDGGSSGGETIAGMDGAFAVTVNADNDLVIVGSQSDRAVVIFERSSTTGGLTYKQALIDGQDDGSGRNVRVDFLSTLFDVKINPNGQQLYAVARGDNSLTVFNQDDNGQFLFSRGIRTTDDSGTNTEGGLGRAVSVELSPDGKHIYTAAETQKAVSVFAIIDSDYGDAPAPYPTSSADNGARHVATGPILGTDRDLESDGINSLLADADDLRNTDDEDGIENFALNNTGTGGGNVTVFVSKENGLLDAWVDFNADGDWDDAGEQIFSAESVAVGSNDLTFDIASDAAIFGQFVTRWRISSAGGLSPTGGADDGEVEDHYYTFIPTISANTPQKKENQIGLEFKVAIPGVSNQEVSVTVNTKDGTASVADGDYVAVLDKLVTIATGDTSAKVRVAITPDNKVELDETVNLALSEPVNATVNLNGVGLIKNDDQAKLSIMDTSISEADGSLSFDITLDKRVDVPVKVDCTTADGTDADAATTADNDYTATTTTLTFNGLQGEVETCIVPVIDDNRVEADEKLTAMLSNVQALMRDVTVADQQGTATGTILNDDTAKVVIDDVSIVEGDNGNSAAVFTVSLDSAVAGGFTVDFATSDGTATTGLDYVATSGQLMFNGTANEQVSISIDVIGDVQIEADETFNVDLSAPSSNAVAIDDAQGVGTINNDDKAGLSINDVSLAEGDSGTQNMRFTVTLDADLPGGTQVSFATRDGSANAGSDYVAASGTLTFAGTQGESQTIDVVINGDTIVENDENFLVQLSAPSNADAELTDDAGEGRITNDDTAQLSIGDVSVTESNGATTATFTVTLDEAVDGGVSVDFATANGTAVAGEDYSAASGTLVFAGNAGETQTISVSINGDGRVEQDETFSVNLSSPSNSNVSFGNAQGTATITNDDQAMLSIIDTAIEEGDSGTTSLVFTVVLSDDVDGGTTVNVATLGGTATAGEDYISNAGQLTFTGTAGEIRVFTVTVNGDTDIEDDEFLSAQLSAVSNPNVVIDKGLAAGVILNDDSERSVRISDAVAVADNNGNLTATFTVTLDLETATGFSVDFTTADLTATAGSDYMAKSGVLNFAGTAGETQTIEVVVFDNDPNESNEQFEVLLSNINPTDAEVVIADPQGIGSIPNDNNVAPVAVDDELVVSENSAATFANVLANDTDDNGDVLTVIAVTDIAADEGELVIENNDLQFMPATDYCGAVTADYTIRDTGGLTTTAQLTIEIICRNADINANDDQYSTDEDMLLTVAVPGVLSNDVNTTGGALSVRLVDNVSNGSLTLNADGSFSYTPNSNFNGTDSFTYRSANADGESNLATVVITINAINDEPSQVNPIPSQAGEEGKTFDLAVATFFTDPDGDDLTYQITNLPAGLVANSDGDITGTVADGASNDSPYNVVIIVTDGNGGSITANFALAIDAPGSDLAVSLSLLPAVQSLPDVQNLTVQVDQQGDITATSVEVLLAVYGRVTVNTNGCAVLSGSGEIDDPIRLSCALSDLAAMASTQFSIELTGDTNSDVVVLADVSSAEPDDVPENNGASAEGQRNLDIASPGFDGQSLPAGCPTSGDINGDGNTDLVITDSDNILRVLLNDGTGSLAEAYSVQTSADIEQVVAEDIDGDGEADVVIVTSNGDLMYSLSTSGSTILSETLNVSGVQEAALADLNDDGRFDLLTINQDGLQVWLNNGSGLNTMPDASYSFDNAIAITTGDVNADGLVDVVVAGGNNGSQLQLFDNLGGGLFNAAQPIVDTGITIISLLAANVAGDASADVLVAGLNQQAAPAGTLVYLGSEMQTQSALFDATVTAPDTIIDLLPADALLADESAGDGNFAELVVVGGPQQQTTIVRYPAGSLPLTGASAADRLLLDIGGSGVCVALADLNGNGSLDVVIGSSDPNGANGMVILRDNAPNPGDVDAEVSTGGGAMSPLWLLLLLPVLGLRSIAATRQRLMMFLGMLMATFSVAVQAAHAQEASVSNGFMESYYAESSLWEWGFRVGHASSNTTEAQTERALRAAGEEGIEVRQRRADIPFELYAYKELDANGQLGLQADVFYTGEIRTSVRGGSRDIDATREILRANHPRTGYGLSLTARQNFALGTYFNANVQLGVAYWRTQFDFKTANGRSTFTDDGFMPVARVGLQIPVVKQWQVGVTASYYAYDDAPTVLYSAGLSYRYGGTRRNGAAQAIQATKADALLQKFSNQPPPLLYGK